MGLERFLRFFNHLLWIKQRSSFPLEVIALFFFFISDCSYRLYFSSGLMYTPNLDYAEAAFWSLCFWQLAWAFVSTLSDGSPRIRALLLLQSCLAKCPLLGLCWLCSTIPVGRVRYTNLLSTRRFALLFWTSSLSAGTHQTDWELHYEGGFR